MARYPNQSAPSLSSAAAAPAGVDTVVVVINAQTGIELGTGRPVTSG